MLRRLALGAAVIAVAVAIGVAAWPRPDTAADRVERIAAELRCPVCQGLSVNDSPSATAREMKDLVAQRVAEGRTDVEIRDEFRRSYGDWILLAPPASGWTGLVWVLPVALVAGGAVLAISRVRDRTPATDPEIPAANANAIAELRARVTREEALEG